MPNFLDDRVWQRKLTRRDFIWLMSISTAGVVSGCAVNPVTGGSQLMLLSEQDEIQIDRNKAPHQISADYGEMQDPILNRYLHDLGQSLAANSHRPNMPYSFRAVNANYVNAYAFPGGSIATTRGILLELENESELAALLGHEIGHVNARHAAEKMTDGMLAQLGTAIAAAAVQSSKYAGYAGLVSQLGNFTSGALLAHYSRDNEREADALGMEYMVRNGYNPAGMIGLAEVLVQKSQHKPSALELMFATHPMSEERYQTAKELASSKYASMQNAPLERERYMDHTASLRRIKKAIDKMQDGEQLLNQQNFTAAASNLEQALRIVPNDYAGLVLMAKTQFSLGQYKKAERISELAKRALPNEAQAHHISGISKLAMNRFDAAYQDFSQYEQLLPGEPGTIFLKGVSLEGMQQRDAAAKEYARYLNSVQQGEQAQHAYQRLMSWGYLR